MSRVLLGGERPRFFDDNGRPFTKPARLVFTDGSTSAPKPIYFGPEGGAGATIVDLVDYGYVPVSGIWLDPGTYNMALQIKLVEDPETWSTLWTLPDIPGGTPESGDGDDIIAFYKTVAEIRLATVKSGICFNTGYYQFNDGGQGVWRWLENSIEDDDGGAYLLPTGQSSAVPGRWARIMPSNGVVSIPMWGSTTDVPDCSGNIEKALQWCSRLSNQTGTTLEFPSGNFNIGNAVLNIDSVGLTSVGAISKSVSVLIRESFRFAGTGTVNFSIPTLIESREPIAQTDINLVFLNGSNIKEVESTWGVNSGRSADYAIASNIGLRFSVNEVIGNNIGSISNNVPYVVISNGCSITIGSYNFYANTLEVEGKRRKAISFSPGYTVPVIKNGIIPAWWFGYGVDSASDHTDYLSKADNVSNSNNSILLIDPLEVVSSVSTYTILSNVIVNGFIKIADGATLTVNNLQNNPSSTIFSFASSTSRAIVLNSSLNPAWYGMRTASSANNDLWAIMCAGLQSWQYIDGKNILYYVDPLLYVPSIFRARNLSLSLSLSSDGNIFDYDSSVVFEVDNCDFTGYGSAPFQTVKVISTIANAFVKVTNCRSFGGMWIGCTNSGGKLILDGNSISKGYTTITSSSSSNSTIRKNICSDGMIQVIASSVNFGNILIEGNSLRGGTLLSCDIQLWTANVDTYVQNVCITGNTFDWTGTIDETILINPFEYGGGNFTTWQDVHVGENTVKSSYSDPSVYPDLGTVSGLYVSSTSGSDIVLFDEESIPDFPGPYSDSKKIRIGPMFLGRDFLSVTFNSHVSSIAGEFYCQQVDGVNTDGILVSNQAFSLSVSNSNPLSSNRFFQGIARVSYTAVSVGSSPFWIRPRAIIKWGDRCDIGRASKVY